jgi:hypothetical protein
MNTGQRCFQRTRELQLPALLGRVWAGLQHHLSTTAKATTIDAVHSDQGRTAGVENPGIGMQPADQLNGAAIQQRWIMAARGWCPPQQPLDQQQQEQTEGDVINGSALWQSDPSS